MRELNSSEICDVNGGDLLTGIGLTLGFIGAFNGLTSFGAGLGAGLYDSIHYHRH